MRRTTVMVEKPER